jgi:Protein of unknown function (DUF3987)
MARELSDWLTGYIRYTESSEPPLAYHTWIGIGMIAGVLQRKVMLNWGFERIYPNMYIILVGPSGRARKGVALGIGKSILAEVSGITMTSENATREALIRAMKGAITNFQMPDGKILMHCSITCFSEELSVFLGQGDIKFLASLTDWYDSKDNWTYETKGSGKDHLQGLCFNLLGATAPDWLQSMLPQEAVGGGFTSRVIFVVEDKKGKTVPKPKNTNEEIQLKNALIVDLNRINNLTGEFKFDPEGEAAYIAWYIEHDRQLDSGKYPVEDSRFNGYAERRATHIRKLMMIMSVSRGDDMLLTRQDFDRAHKLLKSTELKMARTFGGLGGAKYANATEKVMDYIRGMHAPVSRRDVMAKFYRDVDGATMRIIEEVMEQTGFVTIQVMLSSGDKVYMWNYKDV